MSDPDSNQSALEAVLTQWYLLQEEGKQADIHELCNGDAQLAEVVLHALSFEPQLLRQQGKASSDLAILDDGLSGTKLHEFRVLKRIASGGMGTVYLAEQERLSRRVALKVVDIKALGTPRAYQRLRREASIAASLNHPNIVPVYAVGEEGDKCYIAMRHLSGPAMNELTERLAPRRVAEIALGIARALESAHAAGVIHRDVKPANILLDADVPYLVDFGLSRSNVDVTLTTHGSVPGTLPYMAPELLRTESPVLDPRADIYALGATMYELLAGRRAFQGDVPAATVREILMQDPPALKLPSRDRDLGALVAACMEKEVRHRVPSAGALARDLERFLAGEPIAAQPTSRLYRLYCKARRQPRTSAALGAAALGLLVLGGAVVRGRIDRGHALLTGLRVANETFADGRLDLAQEALEDLRATNGASDRIDTAIAQVVAEQATQNLTVALLHRSLFYDLDELAERVALLRASSALEWMPERARPLLALGEWLLGRPELAQAELDQISSHGKTPLALAAIQDLLHPDEGRVHPPGSAEEWLVYNRVLHFLGKPYKLQAEAIERAFELNPKRPMVRYARCVSLADGEYYGKAYQQLLGLEDPRLDTLATRRLQTRVFTRVGELERARAALDSIDLERWDEFDAYQDLLLLIRADDLAGFEDQLNAHKQTFPESAVIGLAEAQWLGLKGEGLDAAIELLERLLERADNPVLRDLAASQQYSLLVTWQVQDGDSFGNDREGFEALVGHGLELLEELTYPRARGQVAWKLGIALLRLGQAGKGFGQLERAMELIPGECFLRTEFIHLTIDFSKGVKKLTEEGRLAPGTERYLEGRAHAAIGDLLRDLESKDVIASDKELELLAVQITKFLDKTGEFHVLIEAKDLFETTLSKTPAGMKAYNQQALEVFSEFYGDGVGLGVSDLPR